MDKENRHHLWLTVPALLSIGLLFSAYGLFGWTSFYRATPGGLGVGGDFTFDNYLRIFGSWRELAVIGETLWISFALTMISLVIAVPMALVIARSPSRLVRSILLFTLAVTFLSGGVTRAYAWLVLLGNKGLINLALVHLGVIERPIRLVFNWLGVSISLVHFLLPFTVFTLVGAVKNLPLSVEEAARNLGATRTKTFFRVTLPLLSSGLVVAASLTYSLALSSFLFPLLLGGGRVRMVANHIYERLFVAYDVPFAAATSAVFLALSFAVILGFAGLERLVRKVVAR